MQEYPLEEGLPFLSAVETKRRAFHKEPFLQQAWNDYIPRFDDVTTAIQHLQSLALIVFKPDALSGGRYEAGIDYLEAKGFIPVAAEQIQLNRLAIETIWRYQWNVATFDRHILADSIYCDEASLMVVLQDKYPLRWGPATCRLRQLKGPAQPELRTDAHLRTRMRAPNRTMSLVHTPDEPIDILRELAILKGHEKSTELLLQTSPLPPAPSRAIHDLDYNQSIQRLAQTVPASVVEEIERISLAAHKHSYPSHNSIWTQIVDMTAPWSGHIDPWDLRTIGAELILHDIPGETCEIDDDGVKEWQSGLGRLAIQRERI